TDIFEAWCVAIVRHWTSLRQVYSALSAVFESVGAGGAVFTTDLRHLLVRRCGVALEPRSYVALRRRSARRRSPRPRSGPPGSASSAPRRSATSLSLSMSGIRSHIHSATPSRSTSGSLAPRSSGQRRRNRGSPGSAYVKVRGPVVLHRALVARVRAH